MRELVFFVVCDVVYCLCCRGCLMPLVRRCCRTVNETGPEFLGPFFIPQESYTDYHFTCRLAVGSDSDTDVEYDVALLFDGKVDESLPPKPATALDPLVKFAPSDFGGHFGQLVRSQIRYSK